MAGDAHPFLASIDTVYSPGELVAVASRDGVETGRCTLVSASGPVQLDVAVDRSTIHATDGDLAYVEGRAMVGPPRQPHTSARLNRIAG